MLVALASFGIAVGIAVRGSTRPVVGNQSPASLAAAVAAAGVALAALGAASAGKRFWQRCASAWESWRRLPTAGDRRLPGIGLVAGAVVLQAAFAIGAAQRNRLAVDDQEDYLRVAAEVAETGGPARLPAALCRGTFDEDNRHPLYVAVLALRPTFEFGKGLSIAFGLAATLATGLLAGRCFGPLVGAAAALLLAVNAALLQSAALVACETLLAFWITLSWFAVVAGWQRSFKGAVGLGALFGLAYLTKASAFLLLAVTAVWMVGGNAQERSRRWKIVAGLIAGFFLTAGPLLVRNARVYGNPLHSFNNRFLFADSFDDGLIQTDLGAFENALRYVRKHSGWEIVGQRLLGGWLVEAFVLLRSMGPAPFDSGRAVIGLFLFGLALAVIASEWRTAPDQVPPQPRGGEAGEHTAAAEQRKSSATTHAGAGPAARLLAGWIAIFWAFFAWYLPIAASDRFVVPLVPPLVVLASIGFVRTMRFITHAGRAPGDAA